MGYRAQGGRENRRWHTHDQACDRFVGRSHGGRQHQLDQVQLRAWWAEPTLRVQREIALDCTTRFSFPPGTGGSHPPAVRSPFLIARASGGAAKRERELWTAISSGVHPGRIAVPWVA